VKIGISIIPFYLLILLFYEYFFVPMLKMFAKKKWGAKTILKVGRGGKVMYPLAMAPTMPLLLCTGSMILLLNTCVLILFWSLQKSINNS
jgi:hypothetical protein